VDAAAPGYWRRLMGGAGTWRGGIGRRSRFAAADEDDGGAPPVVDGDCIGVII